MADFDRESMMEMFNFEMSQLLESLEQNIIQGENGFSMDQINEIFRIMHTIKGSAAMMLFDTIATASHAIEDLFYYLREENPRNIDFSQLTDHVLAGMDFIKEELAKIQGQEPANGDPSEIVADIKEFLKLIKGEKAGDKPAAGKEPGAKTEQTETGKTGTSGSGAPAVHNIGIHHYKAKVVFEDGCEMENVRAFTLLNNVKQFISDVTHKPDDIVSESAIEEIRQNGFIFEFFSAHNYNEIEKLLKQTIYLKTLELEELDVKPLSGAGVSYYEAVLRFEEGSEMENVRAYTVVHNLKNVVDYITHVPEDLIDESGAEYIQEHGFRLNIITSKSYDELYNLLAETIYLKDLSLEEKLDKEFTDEEAENEIRQAEIAPTEAKITAEERVETMSNVNQPVMEQPQAAAKKAPAQTVISVNVSKLDQLLKYMGELVIAEAMVTQNPELDGLELESFHKEARQLRKIIKDLQETVMSMRMVPLSTTFFKMNRIVRDMCKQLNKDVQLDIVGEETEVDKNIIEHISDPLMHIIRNSIDHGIETPEKRVAAGKPEKGTVLLEAKNSGSDVLIIIKDDGAGLDKTKIMKKAKENGLLRKAEEEYTDKEIFQFIFMPGFSTNDQVTSYSGRGVGMDVVCRNLEIVGGSVLVDSVEGEGSTFTLKIPLTLAIVEGMIIKLAGAKYTIPIISIKDSFRPLKKDIFTDPNGNEMITVRDKNYNIVRLYEFFGVEKAVTDVEDGIMMLVENGDEAVCLLVDDIVGEQQVVVKNIPKYIKKITGISGCTLLGNGDISLIIDVVGFFDK